MTQLTDYLTSVSRYRRPGGSAGQRALAVMLSAMLILAAVLPGAAFAGEADSEGEGSAPAEEIAAPGEAPEFEPGGEETALEELPAALGAQPGGDAEDTGEGAPVEAEPEQDFEVPPPPVEETATVPDDEVANAGEEPVLPEAPAEATDAPEPELASAPVYEAAPPSAAPVENRPLVAPPAPGEPQQERGEASIVVVSTEAPAPAASPEEQPPAPRPVATVADPAGGEGSLVGRDSHTVRPGESLWSIAEALLPKGAGNAAIANEVQRLWRLNESRIGTGDPDLLMVGTRLRLR